jgi:hypothetical protein
MGNALDKKKSKNKADKEGRVTLGRSTKANREHNEKIILSPDLFVQILASIEVRDFFAAICTCKTWRRLCDSEKNWKALSIARFGSSASLDPLQKNANCTWKEIFKLKYCFLNIDYIPPQYVKGFFEWERRKQAEVWKTNNKKSPLNPQLPWVKLGLKGMFQSRHFIY